MTRDDIYKLIDEERARQDEKWGLAHPVPWSDWVMVITEEMGEVARAAHDAIYGTVRDRDENIDNLCAELIQVAACAVWWLEELNS
jgi:NTP pyrophosphatase (non-canonical NTP hydrolase)